MTRLGTGVAAGSAVTVAAGVADAESMASGTPAFFARTGALQEKEAHRSTRPHGCLTSYRERSEGEDSITLE